MFFKRKLILIVVLIHSAHSFGQAIPNGNFDDWDNFSWYLNPSDWTTGNSHIHCSYVHQDTNSYNGDYAMIVKTSGCFSWAQVSFQFDSLLHPLNLNCFLRTNIVGLDTVSIKVQLLNDTNIVDSGFWANSMNINSYTNISIPISQNASIVNGAIIYIRSGNNDVTSITVDSLYFSDISLSLPEKEKSTLWSVYPNPSEGVVNIANNENSSNLTVQAFDVSGRELLLTTINTPHGARVDIKEKGLVILKIKSGQNVFRKKVVFY